MASRFAQPLFFLFVFARFYFGSSVKFDVRFSAGQLRRPARGCTRQPLAGGNSENGLSREPGVHVDKRASCDLLSKKMSKG